MDDIDRSDRVMRQMVQWTIDNRQRPETVRHEICVDCGGPVEKGRISMVCVSCKMESERDEAIRRNR